MKITLIENGLDSLSKAYSFLERYEKEKESHANKETRFFILKDAILSMQHGVEILFKHILKNNNEILLYSSVTDKLRDAFKKRRAKEINELFEVDGIHTVTFRESIDRVADILGIEITEKFKNNLFKVEKWRNSIIHSGVVLNENEVSSVLAKFFDQLDEFFVPPLAMNIKMVKDTKILTERSKCFKASMGSIKTSSKER